MNLFPRVEVVNNTTYLIGDFIAANAKNIANININAAAIDFSKLSSLDLVGAAIILDKIDSKTNIIGLSGNIKDLWELAQKHNKSHFKEPEKRSILEQIGRNSVDSFNEMLALFSSIGQFVERIFKPFPIGSIAAVIKESGINALPVIMLTSILLGVVLAYQSAVQLQKFGANIFIADLVTISFIRELGPLIVAMLIAGRSGSAFTAKLGSMKLNEEVDAIKTMGLSPISLLVMPHMVGLMIALPLIVAIADWVGIFGGMLVAKFSLDVSFDAFLERVYNAVAVKNFLVGIIKTPFFAFFISFIGYHRGMRVEVSAESLGRETTNSVVQAIFAVIAFDALFSVFATRLGI